MKKLMIAGVVGLCAAVTFGIESANVVGYQTKTTSSGFNFVAPTFKNVSSSKINIQEISISGDNITEWVDNIQILDEGGATVSQYMWLNAFSMGEKAGWYDLEKNEYASATLNPGDSILIETLNEGALITFSGAVADSVITLTSVCGFNFVGNATPVSINIQDVKISGDNLTEWVDNIQILDEGGATVKQYMWLNAFSMGEKAGWYDLEKNEYVNETIEAGQGFLLETTNADVTITIPPAL